MRVSITIPCRNEESYIARCLDSIVNCNYPKELLEVFVCDGMSDDATVKIIEAYTAKYSYIKLIQNKNKTTPFALNLGVTASDSHIKMLFGAHAEIYPDYIEQCLAAFTISNDIGCVGGALENLMENKDSEVISMAMSATFGVGNAHFRTGEKEGYVDTLAFGAYKKEVFEAIGLFDERLVRNQDDDFNFRMIKAGYKIYLSRNIKAKYYVRASYEKLYKQYYQYGYWKVYVNKKHHAITTLRQLAPVLFIIFVIAGLLFSFTNKYFSLVYAGILLLYFIMAFSSAFAKTSRVATVIQIVYAFLILHWSYGSGYLKGILDFLILRKKTASEKNMKLSR